MFGRAAAALVAKLHSRKEASCSTSRLPSCSRSLSTVKRPTQEAARAIFVKAVANAPVIGDLVPLVDFTMKQFFDPMRKMMKVKTERGTDFFTLGHMVSGAMMVGLVERCKANAFHRDIRSGTRTGITESDVLDAIDKFTEENRGVPDVYALQDFAEALGHGVLEVSPIRAEIKMVNTNVTGTLQ